MEANPPSPADGAPRLGIDLGGFATKLAFSAGNGESEPRSLSLPSLIAYPHEGAEPEGFSCIGERALARRDHLRVRDPGDETAGDAADVMRDFAGHLRGEFQRRRDPLARGVIACSDVAGAQARDLLRVLGGEILERFVLVDDLFLVAIALASREVSQHSILIDIGHTSIRAGMLHGSAPEPEERVEVPFGSEQFRRLLRRRLTLRYPELDLTDPTLDRVRAKLAFMAPPARRARLIVRYRGCQRALDVTDILAESSACLLPPLLEAARSALALVPSDEVEAFQRNVVLVGGGAAMPGLAERLERELRVDGFEFARVESPRDPATLAARGAWRWAHALREDDWSIPLFRFAG